MTPLEYNRDRHPEPEVVGFIRAVVGAPIEGGWDEELCGRLKAWQDAMGLDDDGKAGDETWGMRFTVPFTSAGPLPKVTNGYSYDRCPKRYKQRDTNSTCWWRHLLDMKDQTLAMALAAVSGWDTRTKVFSRDPTAFTTLDTMSIGLAHWWAKTCGRVFRELKRIAPAAYQDAFGNLLGEILASDKLREKFFGFERGGRRLTLQFHPVVCGWKYLSDFHWLELAMAQITVWERDYFQDAVYRVATYTGLKPDDEDWHRAVVLTSVIENSEDTRTEFKDAEGDGLERVENAWRLTYEDENKFNRRWDRVNRLLDEGL